MQTTVVDYIFEQLEENSLFFRGTDNELNISISASDYLDLKRLAKEMEKQQMFGYVKHSYSIPSRQLEIHEELFNEWYSKTYEIDEYEQIDQNNPITKGSTALVRVISSQTEISDEEIVKKALEYKYKLNQEFFCEGAKWYREQLKKKQ